MNQLIPLNSQTIDGNTVETVSARELHSFVESKQDFSTWIKNRIEKYGFVENVDYLLHKIVEQTPSGAKHKIEYYITLDMANVLELGNANASRFQLDEKGVHKMYTPIRTISMNQLIPLHAQTINGNAIETVSARELHSFVESRQEFSNWIKNRIEKYGFVENVDFLIILSKTHTGGRPSQEYFITLDMAKQLAMVENNEKGMQVRKYFIECEKRLKQELPTSYLEALEALIQKEKEKLELTNQVDNLTMDNQKVVSSRNTIRGQLGGTTKQLNQVKSLTGASKNEATINKVKSVTGIKYNWRPLHQWCIDNDIVPKLVNLNDYDSSQVKLYPAQAWYDVYGLELHTLFN